MKKDGKVLKWVLITVLILVVAVILTGAAYIYTKLSKVNVEPLDENDLDVNENLYDEVSGSLSKSEFDDIITLVFFGTDSRDTEDMSAGRSDTIMVVSINPKTKSIKLISIPRDTYVNVPGYGYTKINHAYAYGGEQLSIKTINSNFGLNIKEYATIDFSGLINIINDVGGIEMDITEEELKVLNQYLPSSYATSGREYKKMTEYGHVVMNGEEALAHSRNRYVGLDFARANRQRDVLIALMNKISTMEPAKAMALLDEFLSEVKTNIKITDYTSLLTSMLTNKNEYLNDVLSAQVPSTDYSEGQMIDGIYYFVTDLERAKSDFKSYLYEK